MIQYRCMACNRFVAKTGNHGVQHVHVSRTTTAIQCPVGVATTMMRGLVPAQKSDRVANCNKRTIQSLSEILGTIGLNKPEELQPWHVLHRTTPTEIKLYGELYDFLDRGELLKEPLPIDYRRVCHAASANTFAHVEGTLAETPTGNTNNQQSA